MSGSVELSCKDRPLSPHLSIYRPQITSVLSALHRITGAALYIALVIICWWFSLLVFSDFDPFYLEVVRYKLTQLFLFFTTYGVFYHTCTGIRHLIWDSGRMFSDKAVNFSGWLILSLSFIGTLGFWLFVIR